MLDVAGSPERSVEAADDAELEAAPGLALRRAREAMGASREDVSRRTRVAVRHLESLELADYGAFTAGIYAVGFARSYARDVGVDALWASEAVRAEFRALHRPEPSGEPYFESRRSRARLPAAPVAGLAVLVAIGVALWALLVRA